MSMQAPPTDERFLSAAIEHRFIAEAEAIAVRDELEQTLEPISEFVVNRGLLDRSEVECVRALANPKRYAPGFEILDVIGRGGMGVVFFARQTQLDRFVALKTVYQSNHATLDGLKRFRREAAVVGTLRHPHIVTAHEVCESAGRVFLAMEFVDGIDLEQWIELNGPLREEQAWSIVRRICVGLRHAARHGITHRDIKPSNVLVAECPEEIDEHVDGIDVKIADFGLAIRTDPNRNDERLTSAFTTLGSPHYMAPEQFDHELVDLRCDIYGVGATAYHLLAGHPPLHHLQTAQIVAHKIRHREIELDDALNHLGEDSRSLLKAMLAPRVEHRIQDYDQLLERIDRLIASHGWYSSQIEDVPHRLTELRQDSLPDPTLRLADPTVETVTISIDTSSTRRRPVRPYLAGVTAALAIPVAGVLALLGFAPNFSIDSPVLQAEAGSPISRAANPGRDDRARQESFQAHTDEDEISSGAGASDSGIQIVSRALIPFPPTLTAADGEDAVAPPTSEKEVVEGEKRAAMRDERAAPDRPIRIPRADELIVLPPGQPAVPMGDESPPQVQGPRPPHRLPPPPSDPHLGPPPRRGPAPNRPPRGGGRLQHANHR